MSSPFFCSQKKRPDQANRVDKRTMNRFPAPIQEVFAYPAPLHEMFFRFSGFGEKGGTIVLVLIAALLLLGTWILVEIDSDPSV